MTDKKSNFLDYHSMLLTQCCFSSVMMHMQNRMQTKRIFLGKIGLLFATHTVHVHNYLRYDDFCVHYVLTT